MLKFALAVFVATTDFVSMHSVVADNVEDDLSSLSIKDLASNLEFTVH